MIHVYKVKDNSKVLKISDYMVSNFRSCDKLLTDVQTVSSENKGTTMFDGGVSGNKIEDHTKIRVGSVESRQM